jgi:hypothetical protein
MQKTSKADLPKLDVHDEIKKIIDLADRKVKDIDEWRDIWERITILPDSMQRASAEEFLMDAMKTVKFPFQAGLALFNDGFTTCVNHGKKAKAIDAVYRSRKELFRAGFALSLGRGAMWLGVKIIRDAAKRFRKDPVYKQRVLESSVARLLEGYGDQEYLTPQDRHYRQIVFGRKLSAPNVGSLKLLLVGAS